MTLITFRGFLSLMITLSPALRSPSITSEKW